MLINSTNKIKLQKLINTATEKQINVYLEILESLEKHF